jgi:hypothetical protein
MRSAYRGLNYLIAALVLVQAAAIAYAIAGLGHWVEEDGGVLDKALIDSDDADFGGVGGFMIHGINGTMIIPLIVLIALIIAFFTKIPGAVKRSAIIVGLVVLQVFLGIFSHELPAAIMLHALNAFAIFALAALNAHRLRGADTAAAPYSAPASATV